METDELDELRQQLALLTRRLSLVEAVPNQKDSVTEQLALDDDVLGRRQLIRRLGVVGAGALGLAVAGGATQRAAAANGDAVTVGNTFAGTSTTRLNQTTGNAASQGIFAVSDTTANVATSGILPAFTSNASGALYETGAAFFGNTTGLAVRGGAYGAKIEGSASSAVHLKLSVASGVTIASPAGSAPSSTGLVVRDSPGNLWFSAGTTTRSWRNMGGPSTAGSLNLLQPSRVLNNTTIANGASVTVNCSGVVPAGATAVLVNILAFATTSDGYYTAFETGTTDPLSISCYWSAGAQTAANGVIKVNTSRQFTLKLTSGGGACGAAVDIFGYYL